MRKTLLVALTLALVPGLGSGQDPRPGTQRPAVTQERRAELEQQVRREFLAQVAERLALSQSQQARLDQVLRSGATARHELATESRQLRGELMTAARDPDTPMATYERMLGRLNALREREHALERREAAALAEFLDPRQQALFLTMRMQLNERVRGMQGRGLAPPERRRRPSGG